MTQARKDLAFGIIVLIIGLVYLGLTMQLPRKGGIDSATVPYILAALITALGVIQIAGAVRQRRREEERARSLKSELMEAAGDAARNDPGRTPAAARPDYGTVAATAFLIFAYVALLNYFGFPTMSAAYLFIQFIVLTPANAKKRYVLYAVIAVVAAGAIYYSFLWAFDIMLPSGDFWYERGIDFEWYPFQ